jgi:hypothetical protein
VANGAAADGAPRSGGRAATNGATRPPARRPRKRR